MDLILETDRLLLKPYTSDMAQGVYDVVKQQDVADTMLLVPHPYPRKQVDVWIDYLQKSFELGQAYEFAVFAKQHPERYLGNCGLVSISRAHRSGELGFLIDPHEWGKGYATEACRKMVEFGFWELGLNRLFARCLSRNPASRKVMEKSGLQFEGCFRQEFLMNGVYEDTDYLAILASEFLHKPSR